MTKLLSNDIRERLVPAVMACLWLRAAAKRFGVSASMAIDWVERCERAGDVGLAGPSR